MESKPKLILVVDDDDTLRNKMIQILVDAGFAVKSAENGVIGVQAAKQFSPDLIICEIMMPELDGYGVLVGVSKDRKLPIIPFIFLTLGTGCGRIDITPHEFLNKPFTTADLLLRVKTILARRES